MNFLLFDFSYLIMNEFHVLQFNTKEVFIGANGKKANSSRGNDIFVNRRRMAKQKIGIHHRMCYSSGVNENPIPLGIFRVGAVVL